MTQLEGTTEGILKSSVGNLEDMIVCNFQCVPSLLGVKTLVHFALRCLISSNQLARECTDVRILQHSSLFLLG